MVLELDAEVFGDELAAGQDRDVFQHRLAAIAEAGRLDRDAVDVAADLVDDQRRERFAIDIFGDQNDRAAGPGDLLHDRNQVGDRADLLLVEQDVRLFEHGFHALGIGDEVGGDVALVELHSLDDFELGAGALALFDGDDAVGRHPLHRFGEQFADLRVVGGDGGDLRDGGFAFDLGGRWL